MSLYPKIAFAAFAAFAIAEAGCTHQGATPITDETSQQRTPPQATVTTTTSASANSSGGLGVSDGLLTACSIRFDDADRAPKFDFAKSALSEGDRGVLAQVATCVTTGPLKGRALKLVGRADPRGEEEYNMALGEHRASSVSQYLHGLGVDSARVTDTSRGKLDATGTDEATWQRDRRVDIDLL